MPLLLSLENDFPSIKNLHLWLPDSGDPFSSVLGLSLCRRTLAFLPSTVPSIYTQPITWTRVLFDDESKLRPPTTVAFGSQLLSELFACFRGSIIRTIWLQRNNLLYQHTHSFHRLLWTLSSTLFLPHCAELSRPLPHMTLPHPIPDNDSSAHSSTSHADITASISSPYVHLTRHRPLYLHLTRSL